MLGPMLFCLYYRLLADYHDLLDCVGLNCQTEIMNTCKATYTRYNRLYNRLYRVHGV